MNHDHFHKPHPNIGEKNTAEKNLLISVLLNSIIALIEVAGGLISNSLALISDALHNLGDTSALFIAYLANLISKKTTSVHKTFGYKRVEILAALFNAIILIVIIIYLFIESYQRFFHPEPIKSIIMFIIASIGLCANLISVLLLKRFTSGNINIRAAYLHLIGDTVSSVIVIIAAILIYYFKIYWLDPLVTVLLGIYLLKETYLILKETISILMQATPAGLDLSDVKAALENIPEIDNIHHIHVWNLSDQDIHFECHIDLKSDVRISQTEHTKNLVQEILLKKFHINHVTIQYEYNFCEDKNLIHKS
jgi:cobalt-zinc-cadmium efflux system protein